MRIGCRVLDTHNTTTPAVPSHPSVFLSSSSSSSSFCCFLPEQGYSKLPSHPSIIIIINQTKLYTSEFSSLYYCGLPPFSRHLSREPGYTSDRLRGTSDRCCRPPLCLPSIISSVSSTILPPLLHILVHSFIHSCLISQWYLRCRDCHSYSLCPEPTNLPCSRGARFSSPSRSTMTTIHARPSNTRCCYYYCDVYSDLLSLSPP